MKVFHAVDEPRKARSRTFFEVLPGRLFIRAVVVSLGLAVFLAVALFIRTLLLRLGA